MNILLDAYFDQNFGDDIFIEYITAAFPDCKFYAFLEYYPQKVCEHAAQIPNLYMLPECAVFLDKDMFDAYICVGGDIFPDGGDFTKRKAYVSSVKQNGGAVAFVGFSLFRKYCEATQKDICELMQEADIVAPRDSSSVTLLKQWLPDKDIRLMADLAFCSPWETGQGTLSGVLGISVRKPGYADEAGMDVYSRALAAAIDGYLAGDASRKVKLLCLSDGSWADKMTAEKIKGLVSDSSRVENIIYSGDTAGFKEEIRQCDAVICTRLHAMIACIAMEIPFVPIVYEVKQENILEEIGYTGEVFYFDRLDSLPEYLKKVSAPAKTKRRAAEEKKLLWDNLPWDNLPWDPKAVSGYIEKSSEVMMRLNEMLSCSRGGQIIRRKDMTGAVCAEKQYGRQQEEAVSQKYGELEQMAAEVRRLQAVIEDCQNVIAHYLKTIEDCKRTNSEYFQLIEQLNQRIGGQEELLNIIRPYFVQDGEYVMREVMKTIVQNSEKADSDWNRLHDRFVTDTGER